MKKLRQSIKAMLCVAFSVVVCWEVTAQHSVNLYSGTVQFGIPIYTYQDNDFTIPVSVGFVSSGFRPSQPTGAVGLNWHLQAGGSITREIRGVDDFKSKYLAAGKNDWFGIEYDDINVKGFLNNPTGISYSDASLYENLTGQRRYILPIRANPYYPYYANYSMGGNVETEADIFHFNFMGHSGSFNFDGQGNVKVYNTNSNNGIYDVEVNTGGKQITINTGDGYKYIFGISSTETLSEDKRDSYYEILVNGKMEHRYANYGYVNCYHLIKDNDSVISWMLRKIIAPNGRTITFHYDGVYPQSEFISNKTYMVSGDNDANGNTIVTEPQDFYEFGSDPVVKMKYLHPDGSVIKIWDHIWGIYKEDLEGLRLSYTRRKMSVLKSTYLTHIEVDGGPIINFEYSLKDTKEIGNTNYVGNQYTKHIRKLKKLDKIYVVYQNRNEVDTLSRANLYYRTKDLRTILDGVYVRGMGTFRMDYYENYTYPDMDSSATDFWGYYNGKDTNRTNMIAPFAIDTNNDEMYRSDSNDYGWKKPSYEHSLIGNLKQVNYPTGGYTTFEYEEHTASIGVLKIHSADSYGNTLTAVRSMPGISDSDKFIARPYYLRRDSIVGGVRIKSITDNDGMGRAITKSYEYSDGIMMQFPRYHYSGFGTELEGYGYNNQRLFKYMEKLPYISFRYSPNTLDGLNIAYGRARERYADDTSVEYHYSNFISNPDDYTNQPIQNVPNFTPYSSHVEASGNTLNTPVAIRQFFDNINRMPNSRHLERGRLIKSVAFDANERVMAKQEYNYAWSDENDFTTSVVAAGSRFIASKIYTGDYRMTGSRQVEYLYNDSMVDSLVTSTNITYSGRGQVSKTATTLANGKVITQHIDYLNEENYYTFVKRTYNGEIQSQYDGEIILSDANIGYEFVGDILKPYASVSRSFTWLMPLAQFLAQSNNPNDIRLSLSVQDFTPDIRYTRYDSMGNVLETRDRDNIPTSYIWGYGGMYVVAIVKNATYDDVIARIGQIDSPLSDALNDTQNSNLRLLLDTEVTTYKFKPFVGVIEAVDASGRKLTYTYTSTGKLERVIDGNGHIVNEYQYSVGQ